MSTFDLVVTIVFYTIVIGFVGVVILVVLAQNGFFNNTKNHDVLKNEEGVSADVDEKDSAVRYVTEVSIDGKFVRGSSNQRQYMMGMLNITEDALIVQSYEDLKENKQRILKYEQINMIEVKLVRRMIGMHGIRFVYSFDLIVHTDEGIFDIEVAPLYEIQEALLKIVKDKTNLVDQAGLLTMFDTAEAFYDCTSEELENPQTFLRNRGFVHMCHEHFDEWANKYGFEKLRNTYPGLG